MESYTEAELCAIVSLQRLLVLRYRQLVYCGDTQSLKDLELSNPKRQGWGKRELDEICLGIYDRCREDRKVAKSTVTKMLKWLYKEQLLTKGTFSDSIWKEMTSIVPRLGALYHVVEKSGSEWEQQVCLAALG